MATRQPARAMGWPSFSSRATSGASRKVLRSSWLTWPSVVMLMHCNFWAMNCTSFSVSWPKQTWVPTCNSSSSNMLNTCGSSSTRVIPERLFLSSFLRTLSTGSVVRSSGSRISFTSSFASSGGSSVPLFTSTPSSSPCSKMRVFTRRVITSFPATSQAAERCVSGTPEAPLSSPPPVSCTVYLSRSRWYVAIVASFLSQATWAFSNCFLRGAIFLSGISVPSAFVNGTPSAS
mmetsp:Transcript_1180/g.2053  ORF Transcript_1180/g.2053 Transcript_1180/m.2053 type:complete len:233 (-) Transcript_1180:1985-2683(-)